ncbi:hypothetical protein BDV96DRAFT_677741 [Lophiotrema nucula]|uniref:RING-type domain-containing protein n=1 Tax=Lophiotrema nucula TaxID=690887 RepID=A0A6A5ZKY0_9PLEO|nr:hypothetical protein BDV96DRAFT_677741 [Lophiotrema nucula]
MTFVIPIFIFTFGFSTHRFHFHQRASLSPSPLFLLSVASSFTTRLHASKLQLHSVMADLDLLPSKDEFLQQFLRTADKGSDAEKCTICLDPFGANHQPVKISTCNHTFGDVCIKTWFSSSSFPNTCPLCRSVLFEPDPDTISYSEGTESESESESEDDDDGMDIWDSDNDSDFDCENGDASEDSDGEDEDSDVAVPQEQPQRRSTRLSQYTRLVYNEEAIASAVLDLKLGITRYVNDMWLTMWSLVQESQASVPTKPIKRESILAALAGLEQPRWRMTYTVENLTITIARKMIRKHRENGRYIHGRNHTEDVDDLCAKAITYF